MSKQGLTEGLLNGVAVAIDPNTAKGASVDNRVPEFQSTHPDSENRIQKIKEAIKKYKKA